MQQIMKLWFIVKKWKWLIAGLAISILIKFVDGRAAILFGFIALPGRKLIASMFYICLLPILRRLFPNVAKLAAGDLINFSQICSNTIDRCRDATIGVFVVVVLFSEYALAARLGLLLILFLLLKILFRSPEQLGMESLAADKKESES